MNSIFEDHKLKIKEVLDFCRANARPEFFTDLKAIDEYLELHSSRYNDAISDLKDIISSRSNVLDIGARPYLLSLLLRDQFGCKIDAVNDGPTEDFEQIHSFGINIEKERIPKANATYDVVILAEVFEHLLNPSSVLIEINRLMKESGYLYCTTPNATALGNLISLLRGRNVYDKFSAISPYGRHNREYTFSELKAGFESFGFQLSRVSFRNYRKVDGSLRSRTYYLTRVIEGRSERIDMIFRKSGKIQHTFPISFYKSAHVAYRNYSTLELNHNVNHQFKY